jgi:hypothetical protein
MWEALKKETAVQKGKTALRVDVANAVRRLWKVDADGRIPAWAPGATGFLGDCLSEDDELRQLIKGVASAGSLAVWMGVFVFSNSWMKLLVAGGLTCKRARIVTGKISAVITECRCAVAKVHHEQAAKKGTEATKRRQEQLAKEVREYHERDGRQMGSGGKQPLDQLLAGGAAHQRRRRKRVEDDRAKVAEEEARVKELRARSRA